MNLQQKGPTEILQFLVMVDFIHRHHGNISGASLDRRIDASALHAQETS